MKRFPAPEIIYNFLLTAAIVLLVVNSVQDWRTGNRIDRISLQAAERATNDHRVLCNFYFNYQGLQADAHEFLNMTLQQRIDQFGEVLGGIPENLVKQQIASRQVVINSFHNINCADVSNPIAK